MIPDLTFYSSLSLFLDLFSSQNLSPVPSDASAALFIVHLLPPLEVNSKSAGTGQARSKQLPQARGPFPPGFPDHEPLHLHRQNTLTALPISRAFLSQHPRQEFSAPKLKQLGYDHASAPRLPTPVP